ncbi:lipopolysaccharide biosynthesis protein [Clostridium hydrogeniformans]|uniref:lipopolysaccharide biosynthesis protein n=1 Tax=Clostridium hydrogeniformans TaxID=349933 RepID=UPI000484E5CD|nr:hypothetical protein [Clostridium hydrogeniformans]
MRTEKAIKNVKYNMIFYVILSVLTFVTRKAFIIKLGNDINGLNSLFTSILSLMNLAELGIGSAVMFALYKPIAENNIPLVKGIMDLYKKMYAIAGGVMLFSGIVFTPFLGFFVKEQLPMDSVRIYYIIYLINTSLSYFFSYKLTLLYVNQQSYVISKYDGIFKILKNLIQIVVLYVFSSYAYFLIIETVFNSLYYYFINRFINKAFKEVLGTKGILDIKVKKSIYSNLKALSLHKLGGFVVFGTDYMLMAYFVDFNTLGSYSNYLLIITFFGTLIMKVFDGLIASIGNLISSSDSERTYDVFKKIFFFNFWIVSFVTVSIYNTIHHFIYIWVGELYVSDYILILMLVSFFITSMRPSIEKFKEAAGIYRQDRFAPIVESLINFVASVILGRYFGIAGVILGTILSSVAVIFWLRPVLVYRLVFKRSSLDYFIRYFKEIAITIILLLTSNYIMGVIGFSSTLMGFVLKCIFNILYINIVLVILFRKTEEYLYFKNLVLRKIRKIQ